MTERDRTEAAPTQGTPTQGTPTQGGPTQGGPIQGTRTPGTPTQGSGLEPLISARGVTRTFRRARTSLLRAGAEVHALRGIDLDVAEGERFGVVGESGSGKSTLVRLLAGLDRPTAGSIRVAGQEIGHLPERRLKFLRRQVQIVFQDPMSSLDPRMRVRDIIAEPLVALGLPGGERRVAELLDAVGLPVSSARRFPHQFSGGQRQRIAIARALAPMPRVVIADEPVSALDVSVRAQILNLLADLVETYKLTLVLVSHDLSVVRHVCDRVAVLTAGEIVETGPVEDVWADPQHPYTRRLLEAVPTLAAILGPMGPRTSGSQLGSSDGATSQLGVSDGATSHPGLSGDSQKETEDDDDG